MGSPRGGTIDRASTACRTEQNDRTDTPDGDQQPKRGRPRDEGVDDAVLAATLELGGEFGIKGMSMDEVARRAGVSKATIYRRWSSKEALVLDALRSAMHPFDTIDTGTLRGDLDDYMHEMATRMAAGPSQDVLPHLIEASMLDDALRASLDDYIQYRRGPLRTMLSRAVDRGELDDDADIDILIDAIIGPCVYRNLLTHAPVDADFIDRLLRLVVPFDATT